MKDHEKVWAHLSTRSRKVLLKMAGLDVKLANLYPATYGWFPLPSKRVKGPNRMLKGDWALVLESLTEVEDLIECFFA